MINTPLTVHMVLKNEDRFIWYVLTSILPFVTKILITDTGSNDKTIDIIESFKDDRIQLKKVIVNTPDEISYERQLQLFETRTDWFWIVDADEIYSNTLMKEILRILEKSSNKIEGIIVGRYDLLGDIYHFQDNTAGYYDLFGKRGHFALRLINKKLIEGLHVSGTYPYEGYFDEENKELIYHESSLYPFTQNKLFHAMYLSRSTKGANLASVFHRNKFKFENGHEILKSEIPDVFFKNKPENIPDVTQERSNLYRFVAKAITPLKKLKRTIFIKK